MNEEQQHLVANRLQDKFGALVTVEGMRTFPSAVMAAAGVATSGAATEVARARAGDIRAGMRQRFIRIRAARDKQG